MTKVKWSDFLKPYWVPVLLAPLLMLLEVVMDLLQPKLMADIINNGVLAENMPYIMRTGLIMLGVAIVGVVGGVGCSVYSSIASQHFGADLRKSLFQKVQSLSFRNLDQFTTGSLVTRLTQDVTQMQNLVQMVLRILVRSPLLAIGSCIMAYLISPKLALILAIAVPLLFVIQAVLIKMSFPLFAKVQHKLDGVNTVLQENLSAIRVVKAFVRDKFENSRFGKRNADFTETAMKAARIVAINMPIMMLIMNVSIVAVLWFGADLHWNGALPIGDLVAFINYVMQLLSSLLMVGMLMVGVSRAKASGDRIREVLEVEPDLQDEPNAVREAVTAGEVVFDRVSFGYNAARSGYDLSGISFTAAPGQMTAILGGTGAGKSTLVNLISRMYDPDDGEIRIDGVNIRNIQLAHLRTKVGIVLQQAILFSGSIRDNIRYGRPDASQEEVEAAAKAAAAHDFIAEMPEGYDSIIGQRGVNLSGGQKQRISIARALITKPAILIMDDSTSAVDLGTEARIQRAMKQLMRDTTTILIAQRISSVRDANQIVMLHEGAIEAIGTHDELLVQSKTYRAMVESQLGKEALGNGELATR